MKIPVFVSCPSALSKDQESARAALAEQLDVLQLEPRAVGRSDYPLKNPLREVLVLAHHCSGGVILGFSQLRVVKGINKPGTTAESPVADAVFPSAWNHIEAGILYALGLPLLILREEGIGAGVFDPEVGELFVHKLANAEAIRGEDFRGVLLQWSAEVRQRYYGRE